MKVAVIGSRNIKTDITEYIPEDATEIISGGAAGVDTLAEKYADAHGIPKRIFLPDYGEYGASAPFVRNRRIVDAADLVVAIWDGKSRGTRYTLDYAIEMGKEIKIYTVI